MGPRNLDDLDRLLAFSSVGLGPRPSHRPVRQSPCTYAPADSVPVHTQVASLRGDVRKVKLPGVHRVFPRSAGRRTKGISGSAIAVLPHKIPKPLDLYSYLFFENYSPWYSVPSTSSEERHQINTLSSLDLFLGRRFQQDDKVCGRLKIEPSSDSPKEIVIGSQPNDEFNHIIYLLEAGNFVKAFAAINEWCETLHASLRTQQPQVITLLFFMTQQLRRMGKPEIVDRVLSFLSELMVITLGKTHPLTTTVWCLRTSDTAEEVRLPEIAMEYITKRLEDIKHPYAYLFISDARFRYANVLRLKGKIDEAVLVLRCMAADAEPIFGPIGSKTLEPLYAVARAYFEGDRNLEAAVVFQEVLSRIERAPGWPNAYLRACSNGRLAQIFTRLGHEYQAQQHVLQLIGMFDEVWPEKNHPQRQVWLTRLKGIISEDAP